MYYLYNNKEDDRWFLSIHRGLRRGNEGPKCGCQGVEVPFVCMFGVKGELWKEKSPRVK